ncbi:MAG: hypothetical protein MJZ73_02210 [Bacteroidaceae bacterium]|nr:hypothetical protein [Bacteroidaceae bacterium]
MKHIKYILLFTLLIFGGKSFATNFNALYNDITIRTPNGSFVAAGVLRSGELSNQEKREYHYRIIASVPNAICLSEATSTYNCHSYAWNMSEGGVTCWLNQFPDLHKYWDDNSYVETTAQYGTKVFFPNGDHSAIKSTRYPGRYESKIGDGCLVVHDLYGLSSIYDDSNLKFYAPKPVIISNDRMIGGTELGSYEVSCVIKNTTVTWTYDTNLATAVLTGANRIVLQPRTATSVGDMTLTAQFKNGSGATVYSCSFYIGIGGPHYRDVSLVVKRSSDGAEVYPSGSGLAPNSYYYAYLSSSAPLNNVIWGVDSHLQNLYSDNNYMYFRTDSQGWGMLNVYGTVSRYGVSKKLIDVTLYGSY